MAEPSATPTMMPIMESGRTYGGESAADRGTRRRRQLLDAGLEIFGTSGYRSATVRGICREAKVADRYFYEQFDHTEALLLASYDEAIARLRAAAVAAIEAAPQASIEDIARNGLDAFLKVIEVDPRVGRLVWFEVLGVSSTVEAHYLATMRELGDFILAVLLERRRAATWPDDQGGVFNAAIVGGISHAVMTWVAAGMQPERAVVARALSRVLAGAASAVA
jgi:AcrR family transcriptional regulator